MNLILTVEVVKGTSVGDAIRDLRTLANQTGRPMETKFNEMVMLAFPGESQSLVLDRWLALRLPPKPCPACGRA